MNENVLECALIAAMDEEIVMYSEMESQNHHMFSHRYKKRKQKILQEVAYGDRKYNSTNNCRAGNMSRREE